MLRKVLFAMMIAIVVSSFASAITSGADCPSAITDELKKAEGISVSTVIFLTEISPNMLLNHDGERQTNLPISPNGRIQIRFKKNNNGEAIMVLTPYRRCTAREDAVSVEFPIVFTKE